MSNESILATFEEQRGALRAVGARTEQDLLAWLAEARLQVHFVSWRLKSKESLKRKLALPDKTYRCLWDVTDLVGLRVVTYFEDTIDEVARLVEDRLQVDLRNSTDRLHFADSRQFGYRSLHYVCAPPAAWSPHPDLRFEIQIRTALQHAWAEVEHDLGYKADEAVPEIIRRRFSRIASVLEIADQEFVSIRRDLQDYQRTVREELTRGGHCLPLDAVSIATLARTREVEALDERIGRRLAKPLVEEVFFPTYLVTMLGLSGLRTTEAVLQAVEGHGREVDGFLEPYLGFAREWLGLDVGAIDSVSRGYSLLLVAHLVILRGPERSLSKVEKLTRLYAELDYGGDQDKAHDVAGRLVAQLG